VALVYVLYGNHVWAQETSQSDVKSSFNLHKVLDNLQLSWGLAVSPDNQIWITHRNGNISRVLQVSNESGKNEYTAQPLAFVPDDLLPGGQGGLLDLIFHPNYAENAWIYLSYSAGTDNANYLKIVRFKVKNNKIIDLEQVFEVASKKDTPVHYGGRLAFTEDSALLVTTGDGFDYREQAQVKHSHLGKILRMTDTGRAHPQNPFFQEGDANAAYVMSLGHRNPQGLLVTTAQTVIAHEHGPAGGDEINIINAGVNYGWPVITNGKDYSGATISPFTSYTGMQQPNVDWTPSIAPSGMTYYTDKVFAELQNKLLVTSLKFQQIYAVPYSQGVFGRDSVLLAEPKVRLRDIETDHSGNIWVLGDGEPAALFQLKKE
jgi:glucose/arabinose dehydrogenase